MGIRGRVHTARDQRIYSLRKRYGLTFSALAARFSLTRDAIAGAVRRERLREGS